MADVNVLQTLIQLRRGRTDQWEAVKDIFIPKEGEPCVTLDGEFKGQIKVGDGVSTWAQLGYVGVAKENALTADGKAIKITDGVITLDGVDGASAGQTFRLNAEGTGLEWYAPVDPEEFELISSDVEKLERHAVLEKLAVATAPAGTIINYFQDEIRVMAPADTVWEANRGDYYYMSVRFYAPEGAKYFKESASASLEIDDDTFYEFENNEFAGIDEHGCKYSLVWLPMAIVKDGVWTYYGSQSSVQKYIGWYHRCDWYDEGKKLIGSNVYRVNLSNESCLSDQLPYYMGQYVTKKELEEGKIEIPVATDTLIGGVISSSEINKVSVGADGKMEVNSIGISKLENEEGFTLVLDGGSAPID